MAMGKKKMKKLKEILSVLPVQTSLDVDLEERVDLLLKESPELIGVSDILDLCEVSPMLEATVGFWRRAAITWDQTLMLSVVGMVSDNQRLLKKVIELEKSISLVGALLPHGSEEVGK